MVGFWLNWQLRALKFWSGECFTEEKRLMDVSSPLCLPACVLMELWPTPSGLFVLPAPDWHQYTTPKSQIKRHSSIKLSIWAVCYQLDHPVTNARSVLRLRYCGQLRRHLGEMSATGPLLLQSTILLSLWQDLACGLCPQMVSARLVYHRQPRNASNDDFSSRAYESALLAETRIA